MRSKILLVMIMISFCGLVGGNSEAFAQKSKTHKNVNIELDKKAAIKVAEIVLTKVYGKKVLKQRPWSIVEKNGVYIIKGTFHGVLGGVAEIHIRKADCKVVSIIHGK